MTLKTKVLGSSLALALAVTGFAPAAIAEDGLYVPLLTYRTGPFAGGGIPIANGMSDYLNMLNERDGGIGGVKVIVEECETGYNAQKGVECYEATKAKGALVYNPYSTGITLQLIPRAPVDKIPVFSMGYGLSAAAVGEKFPWVFNYPTTYWSQFSSILTYIAEQEGGFENLKGKKLGYVYLDAGYGKEPIPLLEKLGETYGFEPLLIPVGVKEMQNQSSHWLTVRKERPDWIVMWGWGAMNATAVKEAAKIRFPLDKFIGNWWAGANADLDPVGETGKGYLASNFSGIGQDYPVIQDIMKHVVDPGKSKVGSKDDVGKVLYNRGVANAAIVAEAIAVAQKMTGKAQVTGEDVRMGFENLDLSEARLKELGLEGFIAPITGNCADHAGAGPVFIQQWDGSKWNKVSEPIKPMVDLVRPLLEEAAANYISDKPDWQTQSCS
ncbi:MAG: ABC transporter substrate-binding protein [Pseudomonadota bacterium]